MDTFSRTENADSHAVRGNPLLNRDDSRLHAKERTENMRERVRILLASTMTVVGLAAGVAPAHAAPEAAETIGEVYLLERFEGPSFALESGEGCKPIDLFTGGPVYSAKNTSATSIITLYPGPPDFGTCVSPSAILGPGGRDNGYVVGTGERSRLGRLGAKYYSSVSVTPRGRT